MSVPKLPDTNVTSGHLLVSSSILQLSISVADRIRFLPADALWNLAMAINVYLTLFKKYNARQLKALEWRYHLMGYGLPFIVALAYLFINVPGKGKIYGPATVRFLPEIHWR